MTAHRAACSSLLQITYLQVGLTLCSMVQHLPLHTRHGLCLRFCRCIESRLRPRTSLCLTFSMPS